MAEQPPAESRYRAFLSYSHRDAAAAGRLHRRLEAYRMPRRLVGRMTARGPVPERLWPIFRDREELPAATDLSDTVREALRQSDALIVLCSHHSATSLWVAEEIETFRALHPDRPILAVILDGDPPDCFPGVLRAFGPDGRSHEPLATDLRPSGDGPQLGLLKLVAGITGVGLDDLVQRDAARNVRRVTAVTGAALIAMLIMAALALIALDARREAESQRAEVKGQSDFMLTDLRAKLREVGRLDIMTAVNRRALAYYDRQERLDRHDAAMRARVLQALGEDDLARGDQRAALAWFREAYRSTTALIAASPDDPDVIYAHGQSEYWLGKIHSQRREWPQALQYFSRYAGAAERLVEIAPGNADYRMEAGYGASNMGQVQLEGMRNLVAAQALFEKALHWFEQAERARPGDATARRKQANAHAWIADILYYRSRWQDSLAARLRQHEIVQQLRRDHPSDMETVFDLARAQRAVALLLAMVGNRRETTPYLLRAYESARLLTQHDARNADWLVVKTLIECDLLGQPRSLRPVSDAELRASMAAAGAQLRAQRNPNISLILCLGNSGATPAVRH